MVSQYTSNTNKITYPYLVKYLEIEPNISIAYCDEGKGKDTLFFIHGLGNYIPVWQKNIDKLKENFRCIAIDLPGNGLSSGGDFPYSLAFYAGCVSKIINKLGLSNVTLCAHSLGGQIALELCLLKPKFINKLILIASSGIEHFSPHEKMLLNNLYSLGEMMSTSDFQIEQAIKSSFLYFPNSDGNKIISDLKALIYNNKGYSTMIRKSIQAMLNENTSSKLKEITTKTMFLFGQNDILIPNKIIHPMSSVQQIIDFGCSQIPGSEKILIENAGHFVQFEQAETCNNAIKAFV